MDKFKEIFEAIKADPQNKKYTKDGIEPLYSVHKEIISPCTHIPEGKS